MGKSADLKTASGLKTTCFERAIFLSWYCSKADCSFCYMSTQKGKIAGLKADGLKDPRMARRSFASIFAEAIISKACGWQIEFLSGGYDSFSKEELLFIIKGVHEITGKKQWLNIGALGEDELRLFKPHIEGVIGTLECANLELREKICPSKPMDEIYSMFSACDKLGLKKGITLIIGLGETIDDFAFLKSFIKDNNIARITFYSLNPQKGTPFTSSPPVDYYEKWVALARKSFSDLHITAGAWHDKINYYSQLLKAGANNITKFPTLKMFGSDKAKAVEKEAGIAGRKFLGTLSVMPEVDWGKEVDKLSLDTELKDKVRLKVKSYLARLKDNSL